MAVRYYSNTAIATTLAAPINDSDTSMVVSAASGFPGSFPYTLILDFEGAAQEVVEVSAAAGTTLTISRGVDNTSAQAHGLGAVVVHGITKRDVSEPNAHVNASTDVHGLAGGAAVVGTTSSQTLTNKTISGASNTLTALPAANVTGNLSGVSSVTSSGAIAGTTISGTAITGTGAGTFQTVRPSGLTGATQTVRLAGGTASGSPASGTFAVGDVVIARDGGMFICVTAGSPGTWQNVGDFRFLNLAGGTLTGALVGTAGTFSAALQGRNLLAVGTSDIVQLSVKGHGTQTANLQEWKTSADAVVASISNAGNFQCDGTATIDGNLIGGSIYACEVSNNAAFAIGTSLTSLTWNTDDLDASAMHDTGSNTSRLVAPIAGRYVVETTVTTGAQAAGIFEVALRHSGTTIFRRHRNTSITTANNYITVSGSVALSASGYVEVQASVTGGAEDTLPLETRAHMRYVGPV